MKKIFIILLLSVILGACNNKKSTSIVESFKIKQLLTHKVFEVQNGANELMDPYNLVVVGNSVTLLNVRAPKIFTTVDISTGRVIKQWGTKGQGPNEFLAVRDIYNNYLELGLNIWDISKTKLYFCSDSNLESDSVYFQNIPVNVEDRNTMNFYDSVVQLDTFIFFAVGGNSDKLFTLFNTKNNEVKEIGDFPSEDTNSHISSVLRKFAYNGRIRYNSSLKKIVYVSIYSEMFEIYNFDGADVELAKGNYSTIPLYKEIFRGDGARTVATSILNGKGKNYWVTISNENIFILYQDYKRSGVAQETDTNKPADMVLVFDWNGKPVKIYELDCLINSIDYDKTRNRLWATRYNEVTLDPEIVYFEL